MFALVLLFKLSFCNNRVAKVCWSIFYEEHNYLKNKSSHFRDLRSGLLEAVEVIFGKDKISFLPTWKQFIALLPQQTFLQRTEIGRQKLFGGLKENKRNWFKNYLQLLPKIPQISQRFILKFGKSMVTFGSLLTTFKVSNIF